MQIVVEVKPGSGRGPLVEEVDNPGGTLPRYRVFLREKAVDGAANKALVHALAKHLGVPKSAIRLTHGQTARIKRLTVG